MSELTRMMDNLENMNATKEFTGHFTNSTNLTNNQTYQLITSANNINFNANTTYPNILNSNNNSRLNPQVQHQIHPKDTSKVLSRSFNPLDSNKKSQANSSSILEILRTFGVKGQQNPGNTSEQTVYSPKDKSINNESKGGYSLLFQNETSQHNDYS